MLIDIARLPRRLYSPKCPVSLPFFPTAHQYEIILMFLSSPFWSLDCILNLPIPQSPVCKVGLIIASTHFYEYQVS